MISVMARFSFLKARYSKLITFPLPVLRFCPILRQTNFGWLCPIRSQL